MRQNIFAILSITIIFFTVVANTSGQFSYDPARHCYIDESTDECIPNTILSALPFLRIVPDARGAALGDAGIAISPDPSAMHFNAAKLAMSEKEFEVSTTYTPWLKNLATIYLMFLVAGFATGIGSIGLFPQFWLQYGMTGLVIYLVFLAILTYVAILEAEKVMKSGYYFVEIYEKLLNRPAMILAILSVVILFLSFYAANTMLALIAPITGTGTVGRLVNPAKNIDRAISASSAG